MMRDFFITTVGFLDSRKPTHAKYLKKSDGKANIQGVVPTPKYPPERVRLAKYLGCFRVNQNLRSWIPRKWYKIESSGQQGANINSHMTYQKKIKYLTYNDSEGSRPLAEIFEV